MPTIDIECEFEVFCASCGYGLCSDTETGITPRRGTPFVRVLPCRRCMENEYERGHSKGYADAEKEHTP